MEKNGFRNTIEYVKQIKNVPCMDCKNIYHYCVMDFDHRGEEEKVDNISAMCRNYSLKKVKEEIKKCDIICSNCHRIRTYNRKINTLKV